MPLGGHTGVEAIPMTERGSIDGAYIEVQPNVKIFVSAAGAPDSSPVIFSAPLGATADMWDDVLARLPDGLRTVCYDTRGLGRSDAPGRIFDIARLGNDVIAIMDALHIDRAMFCGVSLGGLTGMWLGANHPNRIAGLILANTAPSFPPPKMWQERAATALASGMTPLFGPTLDRWFTAGALKQNPQKVAQVAAMLAATNPITHAGCCRVLEKTDLLTDLERITCPVRVVVGARDPATPPARGQEIVGAISQADSLSLDASHVLAIERPDEFAEIVAAFVPEVFKIST